MSRFRREDWIDLGLKLLGSEGADALTVDALCAASGRTRGSLYHHFRDLPTFIEALAAGWRERDTFAGVAEQGGAKRGFTVGATEAENTLNYRREAAIRDLASRHGVVREVMDAVDAERVTRLVDRHRAAGKTRARAQRHAKVEYAAFVGLVVVWPALPAGEAGQIDKLLAELLYG